MELTLFLSKVFGLYMLIAGIAILLRRRHLMLAIAALVEDRYAQVLTGVISLLFGLLLVNVHNDWSTLPAGIISFLGWAGIVKGGVYLFLPEVKLQKLVRTLTNRTWYMVDGLIAVVAGLYLAGIGFGVL